VHHSGGPPGSFLEAIERSKIQLGQFGTILDRTLVVSELVYGKFRNNGYVMQPDVLWDMLEDFILSGWVMVYCRPSDDTLLEHARTRLELESRDKAHKHTGHTVMVKHNILKIAREYDRLMSKIKSAGMPVLHYNRDKQILLGD